MMNRIDSILARQKRQLALDVVLATVLTIAVGIGLLALHFSA